MLPAHHGKGLGARHHGVGNKGGVEQDQNRKDNQDEGKESNDSEKGIFGILQFNEDLGLGLSIVRN